MCVKGQADWIDRGKLIDAVVESIFAVWEIHPGTIRFDIGINRADVKIGDQVPEWIAKYYEEADESDSDRIDRALGQCDEHIPGGLVLACAAPWEEQDQAEKEDRDCERCLWRKASRLVTFEDFRKHQLGSPAA
jgi:hypothetical protein